MVQFALQTNDTNDEGIRLISISIQFTMAKVCVTCLCDRASIAYAYAYAYVCCVCVCFYCSETLLMPPGASSPS